MPVVNLSKERMCEQKLPYTLVCNMALMITPPSGDVGKTLAPEHGNLAGGVRKTFKTPEAVNIAFSAKISSWGFPWSARVWRDLNEGNAGLDA